MDGGFIPVSDGFTPVSSASAPPPSLLDTAFVASNITRDNALGALGKTLKPLAAPFQAAGEYMRTGGFPGMAMRSLKGEPLLGDMNAPDVLGGQGAVDPFQLSVSGLKGLGKTATSGVSEGAKTVEQVQKKPSMLDALAAMGLAFGTGDVGNLPMDATLAPAKAIGRGVMDVAKTGEIGAFPAGIVGKTLTGADYAPIGFHNLTKPAIADIAKTSAETGVPISAAGLTGSKTQSQIENFLSSFPFSSDVAQNFYANQLSKLGDLRETTLPPVRAADEIGGDIQNAFATQSQKAYKATQDAYAQVGQLAGKEPIYLTNTQKKAVQLLQDQNALSDLGAQSGETVPMLQKLANVQRGGEGVETNPFLPGLASRGGSEGVPVAIDYPTLQGLWSKLGSNIRQADAAQGIATPGMKFMSSPEAGVYKQLKTALRSDLDAFTQDKPELADALNNADSQYATFKNLFKNNKFVQGIVRNQNPEAVAAQAINLNNPNAIDILKSSLPPNLMQELRVHFLRTMGESVPGEFSPSKFSSQYARIGEDKLTDFLGQPLMEKIKPLYLMSKASGTAEKIAANPSGTGQRMMSMKGLAAPVMAFLGGLATGHPIAGLAAGAASFGAEMEGMPLLAKTYFGPTASKFLSRQGPMVPPLSAISPVSKYANPLLQAINSAKTPQQLIGSQNQTEDGFIPVQ